MDTKIIASYPVQKINSGEDNSPTAVIVLALCD